jgi:hypothetical protein
MSAIVDKADATATLQAGGHRLVDRVADAIMALIRAYRPPEVIFFKTMDNILIALGAPFGLRISARGRPDLSFDTLATADIIVGERATSVGEALLVRVLRPLGGAEEPDVARSAIARADQFLVDLAATLSQTGSNGEFGPLCDRLMKGLEKAAAGSRPPAPAPASPGVTDEEAANQLGEVMEKIDTFLTAGNHRYGLEWMSEDLNCPRFLFFHRFIGSDSLPAIRLHLLKSQRQCLKRLLGAGRGETFEDQARCVLNARRWRIDDSFGSGVSGWVRWPWQRRSTSEEAAQARPVREALVALAYGSGAGDAELASALVVPIHVDGTPWLALAGIFPRDGADGPSWAPTFYRDLLPYLTTTVRSLAERAYLHRARALARNAIQDGRTSLEQATDALSSLAATFPYDRLILSPASAGDRHKLTWRGESAALNVASLPLGHTRVNYNRLRMNEVSTALEQAERDVDAAKTRHMQSRLLSYVNIGHTLKNLMMCTGWHESSDKIGKLTAAYPDIVRSGFAADDVAQISEAITSADFTLSLLWMIEGFGHFIRLSGAKAGNFEWGKFSEWVPEHPGELPDDYLLDAYASSIFALAKALSFGWDWRRVSVRIEGRPDARLWAGGSPDTFSREQLHFPPFREGCEGGYVVATCLLEPLVNAIRALNALPQTVRAADERAILDIVVSRDRRRKDGVTVTVTNLSISDLPEALSGLESTKAMAEDMEIGTFDQTVAASAGDRLFLVTSRMQVGTAAIARAIYRARDRKDARSHP